jgi:hypothetical protein
MSPSLAPAPHEIPAKTFVETITLDQLDSSVVRLGANYWRSLRNGRKFPARENLSPRDLAGVLRNMVLVKVLDGGADFEYRIVGDAQVCAYSIPLQGRRFSEVAADAPRFGRVLRGLHTQICQTGEPFAIRGRVGRDVPQANFIYCESAFLPLGASDAAVDHVLVFSTYIVRNFSAD